MAYLISEKGTLEAERSEVSGNISHIIPDMLFPALANIMQDGVTSLSSRTTGPNNTTVVASKYGTVQSDGLMYYYTNIKGSQPIKDPRIGAHFGVQRHPCTSLQFLTAESTANGKDVYSIDGREWMRIYGKMGSARPRAENGDNGNLITCGNAGGVTNVEMEITGYFNEAVINGATNTYAGRRWISTFVNGTEVTTDTSLITTATTPLTRASYSTSGSSVQVEMGSITLPQITTIRMKADEDGESNLYFVELVLQDKTSLATKSQIQIPGQNVVSHGKKFTVPTATPHYNPFAESQTGVAVAINSSTTNTAKLAGGWSGTGATYYSSELDEVTSLGLSAWESGGEYFRPINGGRIIWWINSLGKLRCSVNMMPPAGTAVGGVTAGHNVPTGVHNWATQYLPRFYSTTIDSSQAEVARTYHWREFGNGAGNQGAGGSLADASRLDGGDNIVFVCQDGLTAFVGATVLANQPALNFNIAVDSTAQWYLTFIGTGLSVKRYDHASGSATKTDMIDGVALRTGAQSSENSLGWKWETVCQNLPYGTHVWRHGPNTGGDFWRAYNEFSFHQPKKPPIPEDAVVIADYMLMADFVNKSTAGVEYIAKGGRRIAISKDFMFDNATLSLSAHDVSAASGGYSYFNGTPSSGASNAVMRLPAFGKNIQGTVHSGLGDFWIDGSDVANTFAGGGNNGSYGSPDDDVALGLHKWEIKGIDTQTNSPWCSGFDIASQIHTSSHYQSFENDYTHELVGGDRNLEQTNLVVTPDGKTWDEVTRNTSYLGDIVFSAGELSANISAADMLSVLNDCRGGNSLDDKWGGIQKDSWCNGWDRYICLKPGTYIVDMWFRVSGTTDCSGYLMVNDMSETNTNAIYWTRQNTSVTSSYRFPPLTLKRHDFIFMKLTGGTIHSNQETGCRVSIRKV